MLDEIEEINLIQQRQAFKRAMFSMAKLYCLHEFNDNRICDHCNFTQKELFCITDKDAKTYLRNYF